VSENLRTQIRDSLARRETQELIDIWNDADASEWDDEVLPMARQILEERLGHVPRKSTTRRVSEILKRVQQDLDDNELDEALRACEGAIRLNPHLAAPHYCRGQILEALGRFERALSAYRAAVRADHQFEQAWRRLFIMEEFLESLFAESASKLHLDAAYLYASIGQKKRTLKEVMAARRGLPRLAAAHNYLGVVFENLKLEHEALQAYHRAVELNPRRSESRTNLLNAQSRLEEQRAPVIAQRMKAAMQKYSKEYADRPRAARAWEEAEPVPQWVYMDQASRTLGGWPGHRTRPGRSGYDPLGADFELAHMEGVILRALFMCRFRTHNPLYLLLMMVVGLMFCMPLLAIPALGTGDWRYLMVLVLFGPYWAVGLALVTNVLASAYPGKAGLRGKGSRTFY
jgi:tetratricopeptide (TPR) repeat protein